ncbi:lipopolysaccharide biosynthesis protein [Edwardsiella tarda]|uniref:lipopolysaccharide biosynthesis protein n=1 Tax=Edwardsiella tarda TaxID=636 RepID=UPI003F656D12
MYKRIINGVIASFYGQGVTLIFQFLSVPLFISAWGVERYGEWLTIFAIPMTLVMLDFGFFSILGNKISYAIQDNNLKLAQGIINSVGISIFIIYIILISAVLMFGELFNFNIRLTILIPLLTYSMMVLLANFIVNVFRANREFHIGSLLSNTARLVENIFVIVSLILKFTMIEVALVYTITRLVTTILMICYLQGRYKWYSFDFKNKNCITKSDVKDSLNYALMPMAFMMNNQGVIFVLQILYGSTQVAIFVTARTYFRIINQFITAFTNSSWQEINYTVNQKDRVNLLSLMKRIIKLTLYSAMSIALILSLSFDYILAKWTSNQIQIPHIQSFFIMLSVVIFSLWQPYYVFLSASGEYKKHTRFYFLSQVMNLLFLYIFNFSFQHALIFLLVSECLMLVYSRRCYLNRLDLI